MNRLITIAALCCLPAVAGCGPQEVTASSVKKVVFAKSLDKNQAPVDETAKFPPDTKKICMSVEIKGRPSKGVVKAVFRLHDQEITSAEVNLADANSGVFASVGQDTNVGFTVTLTKPLPISDQYRADVFLDGEKTNSYEFEIVPPEGATPSKLLKSELAKGATKSFQPTDPTKTFGTADEVHLVGRGDFGNRTWIEVRWTVDGKVDEKGTRSLTYQENAKASGFHFSFHPKGGWKKGKHKVTLIMNDKEAAVHEFTVE